ncbi:putative CAAX prenyl protease 2 [Rhizoctonia solani]|uniref:intramembrane prenyl-peptidase Rce1 n=1 Tax=Rhizoctonia solani TaxID=456999 RepID=A0A0K6FZF4_9AGAM|nr:putative CAAX prenyl protease 2 [Rhizoctonia solani]
MPVEPPVLSLTQFVLASGFFAGSYVGSIYVLRSARLDSKDKSRDDPLVIKARLTAVSASTAGSLLGVAAIVWEAGKYPTIIDAIRPATQCLGLVLPSPALRPLLLTPLLYLGPFYTAWLDKSLPFMEHWWYKRDVADRFASWTGIRNYFASPLTEELVYRSCIVGAAKLAGIGPKKIIFLTPLWFGLAHIHHAHEQYNRLGRTKKALQRALVISIIQLGYTTLFGWYASFLFLRTGSVITPTLAHTFCNIMGMPTIQDDIRQHPNRKLLIWLTHIVGIVAFGFALGPWTRS